MMRMAARVGNAMMHSRNLSAVISMTVALAMATMLAFFSMITSADAQSSVRPPSTAVEITEPSPTEGNVPGNSLGNTSDYSSWLAIRKGEQGSVSIPDSKAGILVQMEGEEWRLIRNGPLFDYLGFAILATIVLLAIFFALRGRIRVEHGMSGHKIKRFSDLERIAHWTMALSFIVLAISGLNVTFGRELIMPLVGKENFGPMSAFMKASHNYVAFAFMFGVALSFVLWVVHNLPSRHDIVWLVKAGGLLSKHSHPPAKKFNAGQKLIFWGVAIGSLSLSLSGWALLFPYEHTFFADTFNLLAGIGIDVPAALGLPEPPYTVIQEQQYNSLWHAIVAVVMICLILAHIYIGSIGMEGAFDAMGSGEVDENWAKEHHSLWVEELKEKGEVTTAKPQPAE